MGVMCCREQNNVITQNSKLLATIIETKTIGDHESITNQLKYFLYDIVDGYCIGSLINLKVLSSMKGVSQLNFMSSLYLCGNNPNTSSAFLIKASFYTRNPSIAILINSINSHINPTLIGFRSNILIVIGGKRETFCECYLMKENKWKTIPRLPSERYHSTAMSDTQEEALYLFGGYNTQAQEKIYDNTILRLNMMVKSQWETITIKENSDLLRRSSSTIFKSYNSNKLYLVGGQDNNGEMKDEILEYDLFFRTIQRSDIKLKQIAKFNNHNGIHMNSTFFGFFDKKGNVHSINMKNHNSDIIKANETMII